MKKSLVAILFTGILFFNVQAGDEAFKKIKLVNGDFTVPSETGVINWERQNPVYPGEYTVKNDADGKKYLRITPLESKSKKEVRTLLNNGSPFNASVGDTIRFSCKVRSENNGRIGFILSGGPRRMNQWIVWRTMSGKSWTDVNVEYKIKPIQNVANPDNYCLGFDVDAGSVDVRDISISILKK